MAPGTPHTPDTIPARPPGDGPDAVLAALRALEDGGPALALGTDASADVPAGTAAVITTSGSSGVPKSVVLSARALAASADATAQRIGEGAWLLALAPSYVAGLQVIHRSVRAGFAPTVVEGHFDPASFLAAFDRLPDAPLYTSFVPAQLATLLAAGDREVESALAAFDAILVGGQALPQPLRERAGAIGARIVRTYGSTETCGGCVYDGMPLSGVSVDVSDGEVRLAGPMLADGYLGEPERTASAFVTAADGVRRYRTGDAGTIVDGELRVTGRIDNVIVSGGVNVSLDRVERVLRDASGSAEIVVVGADHPRWGQVPVAVTTAEIPDEAFTNLRAHVQEELGVAARPAHLVRLAALPRLTSGKPDRRAIARLAQAETSGA